MSFEISLKIRKLKYLNSNIWKIYYKSNIINHTSDKAAENKGKSIFKNEFHLHPIMYMFNHIIPEK